MGVSIGPWPFSHGDGGRFSAFTAIEKKAILARTVNLLLFFHNVDIQKGHFR
jgi:hypothetical protein